MVTAAKSPQKNATAEAEETFNFELIRSGPTFPAWLVAELRSDHAGEVGAVEIYRGALAATRDHGLRSAILRHMETERRHLRAMERVLDRSDRSRLVPVWRLAGWLLGFTSSFAGRNIYHQTIQAVETFVDHHYQAQIERLDRDGGHTELLRLLRSCQADEVEHRDEAARAANGAPGFVGRVWSLIVGFGSAAAVTGARRF